MDIVMKLLTILSSTLNTSKCIFIILIHMSVCKYYQVSSMNSVHFPRYTWGTERNRGSLNLMTHKTYREEQWILPYIYFYYQDIEMISTLADKTTDRSRQ